MKEKKHSLSKNYNKKNKFKKMKIKIKPIWQLKEGSLIRFRDRFFRVLRHTKQFDVPVAIISDVKDWSVISIPYFMLVEFIDV